MSSTEDLLADGHKVLTRMVAISNELMDASAEAQKRGWEEANFEQDVRDEGLDIEYQSGIPILNVPQITFASISLSLRPSASLL